jgi:subtilisin family serine protease
MSTMAEDRPLRKLDPLLRLAVAQAGNEKVADLFKFQESAGLAPTNLRDMPIGLQSLTARLSPQSARGVFETDAVPVLIEATSSKAIAASLKELGIRSEDISPSAVTAMVPRSSLEKVSNLKEVHFVEASTRLQPHCDLAHVASGLVRNGVRQVRETGKGVLVGVIDTGIDTLHPAFRVNGNPRVVDYLDQHGGTLFSAAQIQDGTAANVAPDKEGHGTHVAGIAAGNGDGSGSLAFAGTAPEADLAVVRTTFDTADIARGIKHIFEVAAARQQPCVVNLSLGGHFGGHDGTTILERTIDQLSGPGRIVVASAGNDGSSQLHAELDIPKGAGTPGRAVADFRVVSRRIGTTLVGLLDLQLWCQREDQLKVSVRCPSGEVIVLNEGEQVNADRNSFRVSGVHSRGVYNDDHVYTVRVVCIPEETWLSGWSVIAEEAAPGSAPVGKLHGWILMRDMGNFVSGHTRTHLVAMPGTAYSAICVGSFASRREWESEDDNAVPTALGGIRLGDVSYFSSPGPARDGNTKPEISAPGQYLIAPLSGEATPDHVPHWLRVKGLQYTAMQGTSMAAPYVSGAVALLLERFPDMDWAEAKRRLIRSVAQNGFTGSCWNLRWGFGVLDLPRLLAVDPGPSV